MTHVTQLGDVKIDANVFAEYTKEILTHMREAHALLEQAKISNGYAKDAIQTYAKTSGLAPKELTAYMKARFEESLPKDEDKAVGTEVVINRGQLYEVLNSHLEEMAL